MWEKILNMDERPAVIEGPHLGQSRDCEGIMRGCREWFEIEEAVQNYLREIEELPTLVARVEGQGVGFLTVKLHNPYSAELYVMAVLPSLHRRGIGRALVERAVEMLREEGVEFFQVKTLGPSNPDPGYARTRAFYLSVGFRPLEELKGLWDETNPCLIMVKAIGKGTNG